MRLTSHAQFRFRFISCCLINKNLEKPNKYFFFYENKYKFYHIIELRALFEIEILCPIF